MLLVKTLLSGAPNSTNRVLLGRVDQVLESKAFTYSKPLGIQIGSNNRGPGPTCQDTEYDADGTLADGQDGLAGLEAQGDNMYLQTAASGQPVTGNPATTGFGNVMQGFIETSNVNVVTEITNLISAQRAYEMNSKVITTSDDMLSTLTNLR